MKNYVLFITSVVRDIAIFVILQLHALFMLYLNSSQQLFSASPGWLMKLAILLFSEMSPDNLQNMTTYTKDNLFDNFLQKALTKPRKTCITCHFFWILFLVQINFNPSNSSVFHTSILKSRKTPKESQANFYFLSPGYYCSL